ncbi:MAG TPA: penicillin-binding protein 2, partial [Candidatus Baltobacteraceae bacterium]|nr:penicillin-binding protein 2 [Candidatus Baltobacteraceae bacterium]
MTSIDLENRHPHGSLLGRFVVFGLVVVLVFSVLAARLFYLQVDQGSYYTGLDDTNRIVSEEIPSTRGLIYDRNGTPLVRNVPTYAVQVLAANLPLTQRPAVVAHLSALLDISTSTINQTIDTDPGARFDEVTIASGVPQDVAQVISEERLQLPGVSVIVQSQRDYLYGSLLSQVLGYTGPVTAADLQRLGPQGYLSNDQIGKAGVEAEYEAALRGQYGSEQDERDALGQDLGVLSQTQDPVPGDSLDLTIDLKTQEQAQTALEWGLTTAHVQSGVVIVMDPQTGQILAMVSLPTYDDNDFAQGITDAQFQAYLKNPNQPLLNHAIAEQYAPGSTYKLVTGTGALADKKITVTTKIHTAPYLRIGANIYPDWNHLGFGNINIDYGFGHSSDTFFYQLAGMLGADRLGYWAEQYGFGALTGVDLPGEVAGIVPTNAWKQEVFGQNVFPGEVYQAGIGQGYDAVTPLQLINAYAALANGGKLYQPQIVQQILGPDGQVVQAFQPKLLHTLAASPQVLQEMRVAALYPQLLHHTYNLVDEPIVIAGKSGTSEFGVRDAQGRLPYSSWFVAFVPKDAAKTASDP